MPICTQHNRAQCRYQMHDITMLINVLEHIHAYGFWTQNQHIQWTMPNHVDEAENKSRNHIPLDMLGIPKPILGINDEIKSSNADMSSLVTTNFDLIENII